MRRRRSPEVIGGRVNSDGSIMAGTGFSSMKNSTGNYSLTFPNFRLVSLTANALSGVLVVVVTGYFDRTVTVLVYSMGSAVADGTFSFQAVGYPA
jgi:hypothetical protein